MKVDTGISDSTYNRVVNALDEWRAARDGTGSAAAEPEGFATRYLSDLDDQLAFDDVCNDHVYDGSTTAVVKVQLNYLDPAYAATTRSCFATSAGVIERAVVALDTGAGLNSGWYVGTGTGTDIPSDHLDVWSVLTHELGHVWGWGGGDPGDHWAESDETICADSGNTRRTMCEVVPANTWSMRTLASGDITTFRNAYPH